jgi:hypothetical protein
MRVSNTILDESTCRLKNVNSIYRGCGVLFTMPNSVPSTENELMRKT